jgi:hypothetical protein
MDYKEYLSGPLSKHFVDYLTQQIFSKPHDFDQIYHLIFVPEEKVAWRAAWACQKISETKPEWFTDNQFHELASLAISTSHSGLQRGCLSILLNQSLPDSVSVEFINACFEQMVSMKSAVSVQALSMKMLFRICQKEPDFKQELIATLENIDLDNYSSGFKCSRNNIFKHLNNK